jgi:hypothetical protein
MKKSFIACFLVTAGLFLTSLETAFSQTATVAWGPTLREPRRTVTSGIVGNDPTGFYTLRSDLSAISLFNRDAKAMFLERYDTENKLVFSKELIIPAPARANGKFKFEGLYYLHGQLVLFSSFLNKDTGRNSAFATKVSADGVVENNMVEVASFGEATKRNSGSFNIILSNDSSKVMVFENLPDERHENERFQFRVLDNSLQILADKTIKLPHLDKDTGLNAFRVDNDGNAYVLLSTNKKREERKNKEQKFAYRIIGYFRNEDLTKEYEIRIPGRFISDLTFDLDKNKNLLVAGFYADDKKMRASGTFFLRVDFDTKAIITQSVKDFTPEFLQLFMSRTKAKNENAGVSYMDLDKLIVREDGGVLLVAEQEHWYVVTTNTGRTSRTDYHYENNDIVFVNISPNGSIDWISRVPKRQHTVNDGGFYNSYSLTIMKDKIYLVYNDNIKNLKFGIDPRKLKIMKRPQKAVTMLVTLDNTGNFSKQALFAARDHKTIVRPAFYMQDDKSVIIYSETGRDYRFGNITFN